MKPIRFVVGSFLFVAFLASASMPFSRSTWSPRAATRPVGGPDSQSVEPSAASGATLTYVSGSTVKLQQIIGDCDWVKLLDANGKATGPCQKTASQTITNANVAANGLGYSFEQSETGRLIFMFGDTFGNDPSAPWSTSNIPFVDYHAHDPIAWSTVTDPEGPLVLNFFLTSQPPVPMPLFVEPINPDGSKVAMGGDDIPNSGLDFNHKIYILCNTGDDVNLPNPHQNSFSVLTTWDGTTNTGAFSAIRTISSLPGGHFIINALHDLNTSEAGSSGMQGILMFGLGDYRATDVYLSFTPGAPNQPSTPGAPMLEAGTSTMYFTGLNNGQPVWSAKESDAMPVVQDVVQGPTIGNVSVIYSPDLGLWFMTFDGGRGKQEATGNQTNGSEATSGVYFTYAQAPWGPWAAPQLIFNATRDNGFGVFIHNQNFNPPGPIGPAAGTNDPNTTTGTAFAPQMIERFTKISGNTLTIYYTMSTWNPYTVVEMRSQFTIVQPSDFSLAFAQPTITTSGGKAPVTLNINQTGGFTGNVTVSPPASEPKGIIPLLGSTSTTSNSVSFKIKVKGSAQPGSYPLIFTGSDDSGRQRDATLTLVVQ